MRVQALLVLHKSNAKDILKPTTHAAPLAFLWSKYDVDFHNLSHLKKSSLPSPVSFGTL